MKIRAHKLTGTIILAACLAGSLRLHAQTTFALPFSLTQTSPVGTSLGVDSYGTLSLVGPFNSSTYSSSNVFNFSNNPEMLWMPALGAFRAGSFSGSQSTIGQYSVAFGSGSTAGGFEAVAFAGGNSGGSYALSLGIAANASQGGAIALGIFTTASGNSAVALGVATTASGAESTAMGGGTVASGTYATSNGYNTSANSYASFVTGQYNAGLSSTGATPSSTAWVTTDPLVEFGNGTNTAHSDAFIVYKNGNATFPATTSTVTASTFMTTVASGDIPMYTGN